MARRATGRGAVPAPGVTLSGAALLITALLGTGASPPARAAPGFSQAGDGTFRNITASGGALPGVDVSGAVISNNGTRTALSSVAAQAAAAVPTAMGGQPNGWLKLDGSALVPVANLPPSVTSPVDQTARAAAGAAQATANAALPASLAGQAGGFAALDGNALVPVTNLPAAYTASNAIPNSALGQANGPAKLDGNALLAPAALDGANQAGGPVLADGSGTISAATVLAPGTGTLARRLSDIEGDTLRGADYGMKCDERELVDISATAGSNVVTSASYSFTSADIGRWVVGTYQFGTNGPLRITGVNGSGGAILDSSNGFAFTGAVTAVEGHGGMYVFTDDTAALQAMVASYANLAATKGGAMMQLPMGSCAIGGEIDVAASVPLRISGAGMAATQLIWWKPASGLIVTMSNRASVTLTDFKIAKIPGTNGSSGQFVGTAVKVGGAQLGNGVLTENNLLIQGATIDGSTDGWAVGDQAENQTNPVFVNVAVHNAPWQTSLKGLLPSPYDLAATPASLAAGVADDFLFDGNGGFSIDGTFVGLTSEDGLVGFDITGPVQGAYISNSRFVYSAYGVRADNTSGGELLIFTGNHVNASVADIYNNGMSDSQFIGNFFFRSGATGNPWMTIWNRNGNNNEIVGNGAAGNGQQYGTTTSQTTVSASAGSASAPIVVASPSGLIAGNVLYDVTSPAAIPAADTITTTNGSSIYLATGASAAITAGDRLVSALAVSTAGSAAAAGATTFTLASGAGFAPGMTLFDYSNPGVFATPQPLAVTAMSGNNVTVTSGTGGLAAAMASGDVIGGYDAEYGFFASQDNPGGFGGFPNTMTGNTLDFIGGCALGNDVNTKIMEATGNAVVGSMSATCDYTANGGQFGTNGYVDNQVNNVAALIDDGNRNLLAETTLTIGSYANAGKLTVQNFQGSGQVVNQTVTDSATGLTCMRYNLNANHDACSGAFGAYGAAGGGTITFGTGNSSTFPIFNAGTATLFGEVSCSGNGYQISWHIDGHYAASGGTDKAGAFSAVPEADADTQTALGGTTPKLTGATAITLQPLSNAVGLQLVSGSGNGGAWSCTAELHEMIVN